MWILIYLIIRLFYIRLFVENSLKMIWRRSKHVRVLVDYTCVCVCACVCKFYYLFIFLSFVDRATLYNLVNKADLVHNSA
jgi:hypothetical protein